MNKRLESIKQAVPFKTFLFLLMLCLSKRPPYRFIHSHCMAFCFVVVLPTETKMKRTACPDAQDERVRGGDCRLQTVITSNKPLLSHTTLVLTINLSFHSEFHAFIIGGFHSLSMSNIFIIKDIVRSPNLIESGKSKLAYLFAFF